MSQTTKNGISNEEWFQMTMEERFQHLDNKRQDQMDCAVEYSSELLGNVTEESIIGFINCYEALSNTKLNVETIAMFFKSLKKIK